MEEESQSGFFRLFRIEDIDIPSSQRDAGSKRWADES